MAHSDKPVFGNPATAAPAAPRLRPIDRNQFLLLQIDVDKLIPEDHPARAIWELVGQLDLQPFYEKVKAVEGRAGQPAFDPQLMISVWVYGLSRGIGSARELAHRCDWEPGFQWLNGMGSVNYHSLSTFRSSHAEALKQLFINLLGVLKAAGLVDLERVAVDGTRIQAQCSDEGCRKGARLQEHLEQAASHVDAVEQESEAGLSAREQAAQKRSQRERQEKVAAGLNMLEQLRKERGAEEAAEVPVSLSEPEARVMKQPKGGFAPGYNLQLATDEKKKIIVGSLTSNRGADNVLLPEVMDTVEGTCGGLPKEVLIDGGYVSAENLQQTQERGVELIGPAGNPQAAAKKQAQQRGVSEAYQKEAFQYDGQTDTYQCPEGKLLIHINDRSREGGRIEHQYRAKKSDCQDCPHKMECCPKARSHGRTVMRSEPNPLITEFRQKMQLESYQQRYRKRSEIAEFPNAWIKEKLKLRRFRLRGIAKVATESLWAVITYNIQQWIRLIWRPRSQSATA